MKSVSASITKKAPLLQRPARQLSHLHRWLGTGFALLFVLWFGTGFIMIYVPFPALGDGARIGAAAPLQLAAVEVAPAAAVQGLAARRLRLIDVLGQPRYLATLDDGSVHSIAATRGASASASASAIAAPLDAAAARRLAESFARHPAQGVVGPFAYDQWVVHQRFDAARPFYRIDLGDASGTELYVSARLGQVLQRTTRFERGWNWVGAVVHWIYPTILRQSLWAWDQVVWWLSLGGIVVAVTGYTLGLVRLVNLRRSGRPGLSPFRGWLRWHHVLGLSGGLFALTWVFSGWLSMDHGRLFSGDQPTPAQMAQFRGASLATALRGLTPAGLRALGTAREIEFLSVGGQGFVVQRGGDVSSGCGSDGGEGSGGASYRLIPLRNGVAQTPIPQLPDSLLAQAVAAAWAPDRVLDIAPIAADDAYGHTRSEPLPATTRRVRIDDRHATWVHVDARSGQIVALMDSSRRLYRWLFTGLHTFDFPLLDRAGPLWQVLMLAALGAGLGLSVSALVLGGRRIVKSFQR